MPLEHQSAPGALGPYSASVEAGGFVFLSGQIGENRDTFARESLSVIEAVRRKLGRCGLGLEHVVSATVYLTDMSRYDEFNRVYREWMPAPYPARACVEVSALPGDARIEMAVIAKR
ncbi:MAG: hypothetical protein DWQ01_19620 [Planctomycetota bacterium]|nr:MAG: hypothetical protein DWQ01_19620 [Planctomycetota bacterium]